MESYQVHDVSVVVTCEDEVDEVDHRGQNLFVRLTDADEAEANHVEVTSCLDDWDLRAGDEVT